MKQRRKEHARLPRARHNPSNRQQAKQPPATPKAKGTRESLVPCTRESLVPWWWRHIWCVVWCVRRLQALQHSARAQWGSFCGVRLTRRNAEAVKVLVTRCHDRMGRTAWVIRGGGLCLLSSSTARLAAFAATSRAVRATILRPCTGAWNITSLMPVPSAPCSE